MMGLMARGDGEVVEQGREKKEKKEGKNKNMHTHRQKGEIGRGGGTVVNIAKITFDMSMCLYSSTH